jgi:hypothetical protein
MTKGKTMGGERQWMGDNDEMLNHVPAILSLRLSSPPGMSLEWFVFRLKVWGWLKVVWPNLGGQSNLE